MKTIDGIHQDDELFHMDNKYSNKKTEINEIFIQKKKQFFLQSLYNKMLNIVIIIKKMDIYLIMNLPKYYH